MPIFINNCNFGINRSLIYLNSIPLDNDAQAFITAANITNATQKLAINTLVVNAKNNGWWNICRAIYPFVGGTANSHKYNLKDPRDLDAAFRVTFNGSWTHSSIGAKADNSGASGESYLSPIGQIASVNSCHIAVYSTDDIDGGFDNNDFGSYDGTGFYVSARNPFSASYPFAEICPDYIDGSVFGVINGRGWFLTTRTSSTDIYLYRNNTAIYTSLSSPSTVLPTATCQFSQDTQRNLAFATVGDGVTSSMEALMYSDIETFQITLGRNNDADASAFITAAALTGTTEQSAINTLVINAKNNGWWSLCTAIYPFVGGTLTKCAYNLKNPALYNLTFTGSPTATSTGVTWASGKYADTGIVPNSVLSLNSCHISIYPRTTGASPGATGIYQGTSYLLISPREGDGNLYWSVNQSTEESVANSSYPAFYLATRTASNSETLYRNSTQLQNVSTASSSLSSQSIFLGELNTGAAPPYFPETCEYAFATIGSGINPTIAALMYVDIQTFQTTLGRQI
jgi:hypothetical protein